MTTHPSKYASVLVGGGPAGIAVLLSAHRDGVLRDLLRQGILIVERNATLGSGQIGDYVINSDSTGATFLDPLRATQEPALRPILDTPVARRIASVAQGAVPQGVGELMGLIGQAMRTIIQEYPQNSVLNSCTECRMSPATIRGRAATGDDICENQLCASLRPGLHTARPTGWLACDQHDPGEAGTGSSNEETTASNYNDSFDVLEWHTADNSDACTVTGRRDRIRRSLEEARLWHQPQPFKSKDSALTALGDPQ